MAEVGVLELQIHDNSAKAASGLDNLASALTRVKEAASGLKLGGVANHIGKIVEKMQTAIPEESISRIERLATAIEKLGAVGKVQVPSLKGLKLDSVKDAAGKAKETSQFENLNPAVEAVNEAKAAIDNEQSAGTPLANEAEGLNAFNERAEEAKRISQELIDTLNKPVSINLANAIERLQGIGSPVKSAEESFSVFNAGASEAQRISEELISTLNRPVELNWATAIEKMQGIGAPFKSAEDSMSVFIERATEAQRVSWELIDTLNKPVNVNWANAIEQLQGIGAPVKSAEDSMSAFMQTMQGESGAAANVRELNPELQQMCEEAINNGTAVSDLTSKLVGLDGELKQKKKDTKETTGAFKEFGEGVKELTTPVSEASDAVETVSNAVQSSESEIVGYKRVWNDVTRQWERVGYTAEEFQEHLSSVAETASASMSTDNTTGMEESLRRTGSVADELRAKLKDFAWLIKEATGGAEALRSGFSNLVGPITNVAKQFYRLVKYRMMRAVIKQITAGLKEGIENYYNYSKAINNGFSKAMDSAATSLLTFKNSIGAALAPVIQALIPYLQQIVTWVVAAINYVNQFIALMSGKATWSKAVDTTAKAFENTKKSAGGASKAIKETDDNIKDLLADFDELNIIQSATKDNGGSGSGGGGGGSGKTATDYKKMFTEVGKFSEEVQTAVNVIKNGFGDAWELVKLIGVAIFGWKVSRAFEGIIGSLGKLTAGLTISIIGLKLSYGSGVDIGQNGFNSTNVLTTVAGALVSALGGSMVAKALGVASGVGILIGVTVSLLFSLVGYINGKADSEDALKWGSKSMTPEQIEKLVKSQFDFDVDAEITILSSVITNEEKAREELDSKIVAFKQSLTDANIAVGLTVDKADDAPSVIKAAEDAQAAIRAVNTLVDASHAAVETTLKVLPPVSGEGEDILENLTIADTTLKNYFNDMGQKIAGYIYEGQRTGWKNGEMEQALALMESEQRILDRSKELKNENEILITAKAQVNSVVKNGVLDRDTAESVFEQQKAEIEAFEATARQAEQAKADSYMNLWSLATASAEEAEREGKTETAAALRTSAQTYLDLATDTLKNMDTKIEAKVATTKATIGGYWKELLQSVYGEEFDAEGDFATQGMSYDFGFYQTEDSFSRGLREAFEKGGSGGAGEWLQQQLRNGLKIVGAKGINLSPIDLFTDTENFGTQYGVGGKVVDYFGLDFELLSDELKSKILERLIRETGDKDTAVDIFKAATGLDDVEKYLPEEVGKIADGIDFSSVAEAFAGTDWQNMADEEFDSFLTALRDKFGSGELTDFLKSGDIDIPASDIRIPLDVTLEETVTDVETNMDEELPWSNLWNDYDTSGSTGKIWTTSDMKASNAYRSGVNYTGGETIELQVDNAQEQANTQAGVQAGTAGIEAEIIAGRTSRPADIQSGVQLGTGGMLATLNSILAVAQAINSKDFTVNIVPSTTLGEVNKKSGRRLERVTGNMEAPS